MGQIFTRKAVMNARKLSLIKMTFFHGTGQTQPIVEGVILE